MKRTLPLFVSTILLTSAPAFSDYNPYPSVESYEQKKVARIQIEIETLGPAGYYDCTPLMTSMRTKEGDPFSQLTFDQDLKALSRDFDRVDPQIQVCSGELFITIRLWQKPVISNIKWFGNECFSTQKLQRKLAIKPGQIFNRADFNEGFNKIKEFYIKKGYFEAELQYTILPKPENNEVLINIIVCEGRSGRISKVQFEGLTKKEESDILKMIATKKYNLFTSFLTQQGIYNQDHIDHDRLMIIDYLQNQGYADANIDIQTSEDPETHRLIITIAASKGELYHFGDVSFKGNELFSDEEIEKALLIKSGDDYSPNNVRESVQALKNLYGSKGYIEANIQYTMQLSAFEPKYDVHFTVEEGEQYHVGLVRVLGNTATGSNVILRESLLDPGAIFDSRKLEATKRRLEAVGFFKCVNVYAVRSPEDQALGPNYRDVNIEVEETTTGSASLFAGFSSTDSIFGGLDLTENNFNIAGLGRIHKEGLKAVRGNGEFAHMRISFGKKQSNYVISWLDPYFNDTPWRVGFDFNYSHSELTSSDYHIDTFGTDLYASYPITNFWTFGSKYRLRWSDIDVDKSAGPKAQNQEQNSGIVTGFGLSLNFNSIDNPFKPHRGLRAGGEAELLWEHRRSGRESGPQDFPIAKLTYLNSYYYPVWRLGTFKFRCDALFLYPFGGGRAEDIPLSELFFLGGENTVRGYKPFVLGPHFKKADGTDTDDPTGGISSFLLSFEYNQQILPMADVFTFYDAGSISNRAFNIGDLNMAYGFGLRLNVGQRLPLTVGLGFPINPTPRLKGFKDNGEPKFDRKQDARRFFFAMGGQF
ncbi:MAG: outer membrane protein assembly factor BamA [Candidatus Algichlamydia australiensis]|nr:outer membrane protein assembly factor BamA [Chlamydiales bacterium]